MNTNNNTPTVSVIIPYNIDRGYLQYALESIYNQTCNCENIEIITSQGDGYWPINFNTGFKKSTGELIRFLHEDDLLTPNSIFDTINYFTNHPEIDFFHSNAINFFEDGSEELYFSPIKTPTLNDMLTKYTIHAETVVYRRRCFNKRLFDESLWTGEEYDFNLWLLANDYKIGYLNSITCRYRRHAKQKSLGNKEKEYQDKRQVVKDQIKQRYI